MKNSYKVYKLVDGQPVLHSRHNGWQYADIQIGLLKRKGIACWVMYRSEIVDHDVKRKVKKNGILKYGT